MGKSSAAARFWEVVLRLWSRVRPEAPCLRCRGTGAWRTFDCPDCGGTGWRGRR